MCINIVNSICTVGSQIVSCISSCIGRVYSLICCRNLDSSDPASRTSNAALSSISYNYQSADEIDSADAIKFKEFPVVVIPKSKLESIDNKILRATHALGVFKEKAFDKFPLIEQAKIEERAEAIAYINNILNHLKAGENVSIPEWFHSCSTDEGQNAFQFGTLRTIPRDDQNLFYFASAPQNKFFRRSSGIVFGCGPEVLDSMGLKGVYSIEAIDSIDGNLQPLVHLECSAENGNELFFPIAEMSIIGADKESLRNLDKNLQEKLAIVSHEVLGCIRNAFEEANRLYADKRVLPKKWTRSNEPSGSFLPLPPSLPKDASAISKPSKVLSKNSSAKNEDQNPPVNPTGKNTKRKSQIAQKN